MTWRASFNADKDLLSEIEDEILFAADPDAPPTTSLYEIPGTLDWQLDVFAESPEELAELVADAAVEPVIEELPDLNWVVESQKQLKPIHVGRVFIHGSHDRQAVKPCPIVFEIDAGQAFGTGSHATTRGCLALMQQFAKRSRRPRRVLDLGTGTGVLGLAAARIWPVPVTATDIDPIAVEVAVENAVKNAIIPTRRRFHLATVDGVRGEAFRGEKFDLIIANILAQPLCDMAGDIAKITAPGGHVILSGLLQLQETMVRAAYRARGFKLVARAPIEEWQALILKKA